MLLSMQQTANSPHCTDLISTIKATNLILVENSRGHCQESFSTHEYKDNS